MLTWLLYNALASVPLFALAGLAARSRRAWPALVNALWILALARLVAPPMPSLFADAELVAQAAQARGELIASDTGAFQREAVAWMTSRFGGNWSIGLTRLISAVWLAGVLFVIGRELRHSLRLRSALSRSLVVPAALVSTLDDLARELGVRRPPLRVLPGIASPFLWTPLWPSRAGVVMVVPEFAERLPRSVLAHELVHLRRRDHWAARLELFVLGLFWWNPLAWMAQRRAQLSAELACDAEVMTAFPAERGAYARTLVATLEQDLEFSGERRPIGATRAIGQSAEELTQRLERILAASPNARRAGLWKVAAVVLLVLSLPGVGAPSVDAFRLALPSIPNGLAESTCLERLEFARRALLADPTDGSAFDVQGRALMGLARFDEAARAFERQGELGHRLDRAHYNAACAYALAGRESLALDFLERAVATGIPRRYLKHDLDLRSLRTHARFSVLLDTCQYDDGRP